MTAAPEVATARLNNARVELETACAKLDVAVDALSFAGGDGDTVIANPGLLALLLRVVRARRHVNRLESVRSASELLLGPGKAAVLPSGGRI